MIHTVLFSEDVIKRRLLIDGDGTGDDRRLMLILKTFVNWCNSTNETPADTLVSLYIRYLLKLDSYGSYILYLFVCFRKMMQEQLLGHLSLCEYMFEKSKIASQMNAVELTNYGKLADEIRKEIEKTKTEIQKAKEELQKAKIYRKNRIEYEVIANVIDKHPERTETDRKLMSTRKELANLEVIKRVSPKRDSFLILHSSSDILCMIPVDLLGS